MLTIFNFISKTLSIFFYHFFILEIKIFIELNNFELLLIILKKNK